MGRWWVDVDPIVVFLHFDGDEWEVVQAPDEITPGRGESLGVGNGVIFDVAPDGTLWTLGDRRSPHTHRARYDGSGWTIFGKAEGVRPWGGQRVGVWDSPFDVVRVAPDGSVWVNAWTPGERLRGCGGLGRFDGESWASYLPGTCISDYDFAPDGAVWVVASEPQHVYEDEHGVRYVDLQTYVITPEAVAATE